ncbi:MAG: leucyl/phenylalanyl-tRNA--protein transferase [Ignavibacteriae bacterium HGW-Ignavibacteriae-4]|jgi:leucyl/phenylalanyl-tRNA--protein transferase|nr:MAG: leucyl/phenylalanyl-tRNA--protein transferase [Ignavibacteriae bacterium HGW-Ignavibacteriae-4]
MTNQHNNTNRIIKPEVLIQAYKQGYFPMADHKEGDIYWHCPDPRAVIPLESPKKPKSLRRSEKKYEFEYRVDTCFRTVMEKCAERDDTWISDEIIETYMQLYYLGMAHSVETFEDDVLVGGLYGVAIGGAFFGESMFNTVTDASKGAFFYLIERLKERNYLLLDSQYINPFTKQLGAIELSYTDYTKRLIKAINLPTSFVD